MIARLESFDFRKKNWLSCLYCSYQQDSQTAPVCCGTKRHGLPRLLFPEPMVGDATCREGTYGSAGAGTSWRLHELFWNTLIPPSQSQTCSCWLFLLSPVILTYQWSNLLFLLYLSVQCVLLIQSISNSHYKACKLL